MKKLITFLTILFLPVLILAQNPFQGILYNINDLPVVTQSKTRQFTADTQLKFRADSSYTIKLLRASMSVGGMQYLYNKTEKRFDPQAFLKVGTGLSFSFYNVCKGVAKKLFSIDGFIFWPIPETGQKLSIATGVSAFDLFGTGLNPQIGINFEPFYIKSNIFPIGPMLGLKYNFGG